MNYRSVEHSNLGKNPMPTHMYIANLVQKKYGKFPRTKGGYMVNNDESLLRAEQYSI